MDDDTLGDVGMIEMVVVELPVVLVKFSVEPTATLVIQPAKIKQTKHTV